ncbi:hypothetical protein FF2_009255 [Malus domestica]
MVRVCNTGLNSNRHPFLLALCVDIFYQFLQITHSSKESKGGITSYSTGNGASRSIPKAGNAESIKDKAIQSERKAIHLLSLKRKTDWIVRTSVPSLGKPSSNVIHSRALLANPAAHISGDKGAKTRI